MNIKENFLNFRINKIINIYIVFAFTFITFGLLYPSYAFKVQAQDSIEKQIGQLCNINYVSITCSTYDHSCILGKDENENYIQNNYISLNFETKSKNNSNTKFPSNILANIPIQKAEAKEETSLNPNLIFELINEVRKNNGLQPFQKDNNLCSLAEARGPEMVNEVYTTGRFHSGLYARNLPYWVTENLKYGGDEGQVVSWWLNSPIHRKAILGSDKYSCANCVGQVCNMLFTSYTPK